VKPIATIGTCDGFREELNPSYRLSPSRVLPAHQVRRRISPLQRGDVRERLVVVHRLFHAGAVFPQASGLFSARLALGDTGVDPGAVGGRQLGGV
jgi:hypothetical protein